MKIDIHTHTRRCKTGDAPTREIAAADFCEKLLATEVRIIAITNHNAFDLAQYSDIIGRLGGAAQVWPGIELDVIETGGSRGHLLVIASPSKVAEFSEAADALINGTSPNDFTATIDQVLGAFDSLAPLYVAHYRQKKPNISDDALEELLAKVARPSCVIKEVTKSISAGIYISHGHPSIYGSDVHDWAEYEELSKDLPDLRLPVDSFEHFCLLLEKDATTINTLLHRKTAEELVLLPFSDAAFLKIRVFNDINVFFGPKGTGKTCILRAIAKHYSDNGLEASVYESSSDKLDEAFDKRGQNLVVNLDDYEIDHCTSEIQYIRGAVEVPVTNLSKYINFFQTTTTNRNSQRILLKNLDLEDASGAKRQFEGFHTAGETVADFVAYLAEDPAVAEVLAPEELQNISSLLNDLLDRLGSREWSGFTAWKEISLLNSAITLFRLDIERKTGNPAKPTSTGFRDYALNRIAIEVNAAKIIQNVDSKIPQIVDAVGSLGPAKGNLEFRTDLVIQDGTITDGGLTILFGGIKKIPQKKFVQVIRQILTTAYSETLFQHISELNEVDNIEQIDCVNKLLMFRRQFCIDGTPYSPSSGEASMVLLQKELEADKDIYILDEPEKSLGNEYISEVIVPLIKERALAGKKVFISTHDANIAVRTLPYSSIYRCHGPGGYRTYSGNPFSNNLINAENPDDQLDWKKISMRTLEGGEEAFGERGKIYGNN